MKLSATLLVGLMALGSVVLWIGVPLGWIWLASNIVDSSEPSMTPYVMVLVGIPLTMVVVGKGLSQLNRVYGEVTGTTPTVRVVLPWHRSMRGERDAGHPRTILDVVMVCSVTVALVLFGLWFFLFAGSSIPTP